ncbi:MAG: hypothetical protein U0414_27330 [Polyangiaceae bacterium]
MIGAALASGAATSVAGCGGIRRFPLRDPVWIDEDLRAVRVPCRPDPKDAKKQLCRPEEYESPFLWDVADKTIFRPIVKFFAADVGFAARNVNAVDEVPDSSWFTNRIGVRPMTDEEITRGSCGHKTIATAPHEPGAWRVDMGKANGANPGFRVEIEGVGKFMLKADAEGEGEKATGATSIASRLYHAAGWWTACDTIVYVDKSWLRLEPGLDYADNTGTKMPFDDGKLQAILDSAQKRGGLVRMVASRWLPGRAIGPFRYEETREDDPNDIIPHEDRRDLRGARLMAAWLGHFDSREQNTMTTWDAVDPESKDSSPGRTTHWYIDLGDCFGSHWQWESWNRRINHSYYFDPEDVAIDLLTLGSFERPWDRPVANTELPMFDYFRPDFVPEDWKGGYPNPAFARMTEEDGAWAARILSRFTDANIAAAVRVGDYTDPRATEFLTRTLIQRRDEILTRYFSVVSPLADVTVEGDRVCATDLAHKTTTWPRTRFTYAAELRTGLDLDQRKALPVSLGDDATVCVDLPRVVDDRSLPDDHPLRYAVLDVSNGAARGPLRVHLYDLGASSHFKMVAIQRPDEPGAALQ